MKRLIVLLVSCIYTLVVFSQDTIYKYYDKFWSETSKDNYLYTGKLYKNTNDKWIEIDYYKKGIVKMKVEYDDQEAKFRNGKYICYFENGKVSEKGLYVKNKKDGEWIWYFENGKACAKENYNMDKLIDGKFWNESGKEVQFKQKDLSEFYPGGNDSLKSFIARNLNYPLMARETGISGTVYVAFFVNKDGKITDITVKRGIGGGCDEEAIRVIKLMPKWLPVINHNRIEKTDFFLPIKFTLI